MSVALNPKPMLAGAADAGAPSRSTAAASTAGTSAMTFIFIFQVLPCCHRESVAHPAGDAAPAAPPSQLLNIKHEHLSRRTGERRPGCLGVAHIAPGLHELPRLAAGGCNG